MGDQHNLERGLLHRSLVGTAFRLGGFSEAEARPTRRLKDALEDGPTSDISGVPGVFIRTRADIELDGVGGALDAAEQSALWSEDDLVGVVAQFRRWRDDPLDGYAVLSIRGLIRLMHLAFPAQYPASLSVLEHDLAMAMDAPQVPHPDAPQEDG